MALCCISHATDLRQLIIVNIFCVENDGEKRVDGKESDDEDGLEALLDNIDIHDLYNLDQT